MGAHCRFADTDDTSPRRNFQTVAGQRDRQARLLLLGHDGCAAAGPCERRHLLLRRRRCFELPRFLSSSGSPVPLLSLPRSLGEEARVALACAAPAQPWNGTAKKKSPCWIRPADMDLDTLGVAYVRASATFHGLVVDFSRATSGSTKNPSSDATAAHGADQTTPHSSYWQ